MRSPLISSVAFTPAPPSAVADGLLGCVDVVLNDATVIDNVRLCLAQNGRLHLAFPTRTDRWGRRHHTVRPLDNAARVAMNSQVFAWMLAEGRSAS